MEAQFDKDKGICGKECPSLRYCSISNFGKRCGRLQFVYGKRKSNNSSMHANKTYKY